MKKFLLSLATVLCASAFASAADVEVAIAANKFTAGADAKIATYTTNGFTFTLDQDESTTANRYTDTDHLRIYAKANFTVKGDNGQQITKMVFSYTSTSNNKFAVLDNVGSITNSGTTGTWTGDANKITFDATAQTRVKSVVITYTSAGEVVVKAPEFSPAGGKFAEAQAVTLTSEGNTIYYTIDGADPTDDTADGSTIKYTDPITIDKTTTIKAIAFDANDNKSSISSQTYTIVETYPGAEGDGTEANPYNAAGAYNAALLGSTANVYVKGIVVSKSAINTKYGSISYYISEDGTETNQFYIYSGLGLGGQKFTSDDELNVGDKVVVNGNLSTHNDIPQFNYNSIIVSINGEEPEPIVLEGDGTGAKPFTVADVRAINPTSTTENPDYPEKYWVKGYIVGRCDGQSYAPVFSATAVDDATAIGATNIVIAPTADCTNANLCIPVALPTGNVRDKLNLKDNPKNLGQVVEVYGNIYAYFNQPGVRNTSDYKLNAAGVEGIEIDENAPVEYYNLQGVRVENPANGLYIMRQGDKVVKVIK